MSDLPETSARPPNDPENFVTREQWLRMSQDCAAAYPNEACGLFVGPSWSQAELVSMENMQDRYHERDPVRFPRTARTAYTMHALRLSEQVDRAGGLLAIWHSHCEVGAYFSEEDVRVALGGGDEPLWPGTSYLVLSCRNRHVDGAKWFTWDPATRKFLGREATVLADL
jgi:proteasome lid subunit RPN8/RPN11